MYFYVKALHIIFIVTWFSGMFYIVRLFIYNTEAQEKTEVEKQVLTPRFSIMIRRLWLASFFNPIPQWLWIKLGFVVVLYGYHFTLQKIYSDEMKGVFRYSSNQLR